MDEEAFEKISHTFMSKTFNKIEIDSFLSYHDQIDIPQAKTQQLTIWETLRLSFQSHYKEVHYLYYY